MSVQDVTSKARWVSADTTRVTVNGTGLVTAVKATDAGKPVVVTGSYQGQSAACSVTVTPSLTPRIVKVEPAQGDCAHPPQVTITVADLDASVIEEVLFSVTPATGLHHVSATELTCTPPPSLGSGGVPQPMWVDVSVRGRRKGNLTTLAVLERGFTYTAAKQSMITSVSPSSGAAGTAVTITVDQPLAP